MGAVVQPGTAIKVPRGRFPHAFSSINSFLASIVPVDTCRLVSGGSLSGAADFSSKAGVHFALCANTAQILAGTKVIGSPKGTVPGALRDKLIG